MRTCLVLGAGASLANALFFRGQRMQSSRPPLDTTFFATVQALGLPLPPALRAYFTTLTRSEPLPELVRQLRMEDFFKDIFFDFQDSPSSAQLRSAYAELVELYVRVLRETTNWLCADGREGAPVGRLVAAAAESSEVVTVITFNHDLVIENEIARRARLRTRWCLDHGYGTFGTNTLPLPPSTGDTFHVHEQGLCEHERPINVLKLHGSLNWRVRIAGNEPTARVLSGEAGTRDIHLTTSRLAPRSPMYRRGGSGSGRSVWRLWPVVIPPVYAKQALRRRLQDVWSDAQTALQTADRVVFFGYSLPVIDVEAEKLFERGIAANSSLSWADVINPDPAAAQRYAGLAPSIPIRYFPTFRHFNDSRPF